mgnify:CR=1 FL=1
MLSDKEDKEQQNESAEEKVADSDAQSTPLDFVEGANDEMAEALREKEQFKRLAQRAQADLVNYRRRIESEQESLRLRIQQQIVLRFADVIDQLDVALSSHTMDNADANWLEGITAIQMDIKITGVTREILENALEQARAGRAHSSRVREGHDRAGRRPPRQGARRGLRRRRRLRRVGRRAPRRARARGTSPRARTPRTGRWRAP